MSVAVNRNRQHQNERTSYNPDLEYGQAAIANELYGPGAPGGFYGMTGGDYPVNIEGQHSPPGYGYPGSGTGVPSTGPDQGTAIDPYTGKYVGTGITPGRPGGGGPGSTVVGGSGGSGGTPGGRGPGDTIDSGGGTPNYGGTSGPGFLGGGGDRGGGKYMMGVQPVATSTDGRASQRLDPMVKKNMAAPYAAIAAQQGSYTDGVMPAGTQTQTVDPQTGAPLPAAGSIPTGVGPPGAAGGGFRYTPGSAAGYGTGGVSGNRNIEGGMAFGGYAGMMQNPGWTPEEKAAISNRAQTTTRAAFDAEREQLANRTAATGNSASFSAAAANLGRNRAIAQGDTAQGTEIAAAQEKQRQKEAGIEGIAKMYGIDTQTLLDLLGQRGRLASLPRYQRTEGAGTGGGGGFNFASMAGGG